MLNAKHKGTSAEKMAKACSDNVFLGTYRSRDVSRRSGVVLSTTPANTVRPPTADQATAKSKERVSSVMFHDTVTGRAVGFTETGQ